jgi:hypothetical protein
VQFDVDMFVHRRRRSLATASNHCKCSYLHSPTTTYRLIAAVHPG